MQKGFTLFIAMVVTGTLLLVATGVINLALRHTVISSFWRESQFAFYAADTGLECALYWDIQNASGNSAFATSTGTLIECNFDANPSNGGNNLLVGGSDISTFSLTFLPDPYCATVTVNKSYVLNNLVTTIESKGYNTCDSSSTRRVERAIRATY